MSMGCEGKRKHIAEAERGKGFPLLSLDQTVSQNVIVSWGKGHRFLVKFEVELADSGAGPRTADLKLRYFIQSQPFLHSTPALQ